MGNGSVTNRPITLLDVECMIDTEVSMAFYLVQAWWEMGMYQYSPLVPKVYDQAVVACRYTPPGWASPAICGASTDRQAIEYTSLTSDAEVGAI